jgi:hypothetical protein
MCINKCLVVGFTAPGILWKSFSRGTIGALLLLTFAFAETADDPALHTYQAHFTSQFADAYYLFRYDMASWVAADSVSARLAQNPALKDSLGAEWFCFQDGPFFHAVYGKYYPGADVYTIVCHFAINEQIQFAPAPPIDTMKMTAYARSLHNSFPVVKYFLRKHRLRLDRHILGDSTGITVWHTPAQMSNDAFLYGGDFRYHYDATGAHLLDSAWNHTDFYAVRPGRKTKAVELKSEAFDYPTVGDLLSALNILKMYKKGKLQVVIKCKAFQTKISRDAKGGYSFSHEKRQSQRTNTGFIRAVPLTVPPSPRTQ